MSDPKKIKAGDGIKCPRCRTPTVRWRHGPDWKPPLNKGWYRMWDECMNPRCRTTLLMPKEHYVPPPNKNEGKSPPFVLNSQNAAAFNAGYDRGRAAERKFITQHLRMLAAYARDARNDDLAGMIEATVSRLVQEAA